MANTIKWVRKNLFQHLYPEIHCLTLVLKTTSGIYYAWKNGECVKYNYWKDSHKGLFKGGYDAYFQEYVCKDIKNPFTIIQYNGYWSTDLLVVRDFGEYLGIIMPRCIRLKVGDFKESPDNAHLLPSQIYGCHVLEFRVYKDRKTMMVHYSVTKDNSKYFGYIVNPKYKSENRWDNSRYGYYEFRDMNTDRAREQWEKKDADGNYKWIAVDPTDDLHQYAIKPSASDPMGWAASSFWSIDFRKGWAQPLPFCDHGNSSALTLTEETANIINNFFNDLDPKVKSHYQSKFNRTRMTTMEHLCQLITCPDAAQSARQLEKRQNEEAYFETLCDTLTWNRVDRGLAFDRIDNKIYVTCYRDGATRPSRWYDSRSGVAILVYDTIKKTKKLYIKPQGSKLSIPIPGDETILEWFNTSPNYSYGADCAPQFQSEAPIVWVKPFEEIFAGTNVELFLNICPKDLIINSILVSGEYEVRQHFGVTTVPQLISANRFWYFGWRVFFSTKNCICEQLLKSNLLYLYLAYREGDHFLNVDNNDRAWSIRFGYHGKAKSLKKCFGLSMNQLKIVDEFIKEHYLKHISINEYRSGDHPPLVPSIYGLDKVLNIDIRGIDNDTFKRLLALSDQRRGSCGYFSWNHFSDCQALLNVTKTMSPHDIFEWLSRGYNLEQYNDYLKMRSKLQQISIDLNRPELFNEKAYPIKIKDPEDVKRLHDLCEKITFQYQNAAKARMFDSTIQDAKKFEWEDAQKEPDRMQIIVPQTISDLVYEGTELHHCVKSPMWIDAIAERSSVILFIRKCDAKDVPFFTVELNPQGGIRQCHGLSNCNPTKEVINFLHRWAKAKKSIVSEQSIAGHYGMYCAPKA